MLLSAIAWVGCAVVLIVAAVRSLHRPAALRLGRLTTGVLFLAAGAAMNGWFLLRGDDDGEFADGAHLPFVRHTWDTVVVPYHHWWIALLIVFEFHISPVRSSSRPHTGVGTVPTRSTMVATTPASSARRTGLLTANPRSGITPSRQPTSSA